MTEKELDLDKVYSEIGKVLDLISVLRSSFWQKDFDKVEGIIVERGTVLKDQILHWTKKYDLMEKEHGEAMLSQFLAEEELEKCRRMLDELAEQAKELEKDNKLYDNKVAVYEGREKREGTKYEKLLDDFLRLERENQEKVEFYKERQKTEETKHVKLLEDFQRLERENKEKVAFYEEREKRAGTKYEKLLEDFEMLGRENKEKVAFYEEREKREGTKYEKLLEDFQMLERENKEKVAFYEEKEKRVGTKYEKLLEDVRMLERENKEKEAFYEEREKREGTKYEKLLEDLEKLEKENRELVGKNSELSSARDKAERQLESVKKKKEELSLRVTHLEEDVEMLMSKQIVQPKVVEEKDSMNFTNENGAPVNTRNGNLTEVKVKEVTLKGHEKGNSSNQLKEAGFVIRPCDEGISFPKQRELKRGSRFQRDEGQKPYTAGGNFESGVVEISDSDDEMPLPIQNQTPKVPSKRRRGASLKFEERQNDYKTYGLTLSAISTSDSDCDSETLNELMKGYRRGSQS